MEIQLVIFQLADELYGVNIHSVESIIKLQTITAVPHAPDFVEGVTNLRGNVLPIIDLRKRFGLELLAETSETRIVVLEIDGMQVGMVVDGVKEVLTIQEEAVEPPSPIVSGIDTSFITGIAKVADDLIILLDLSKVLNAEETSQITNL